MHDFSTKIKRTLAADEHFATIALKNDQVWELSLAEGEPPALAVQTTYGLHCRGLKIFPRFTQLGTTLTDPRTFASPVRLEKRLSNYARVNCAPFISINVILEYWVPSSNSICGRMSVINSGERPISFNCEWAVALQPLGQGEPMTSAEMGINTVLRGATEGLFPVFFLTGGPLPSDRAYPALALDVTLTSGMERQVSWSLATLESYEASFTLARQNTALAWDNELTQHEMFEKRHSFFFVSGSAVLDDLLHETQIRARQCLIKGPAPVSRLTLLSKRQPDVPLGNFAISARTRQTNLPATAYDLWQASRILLPADADIFKDLILEVIDHQQANGAIPWSMAANGTASKALMPPLLGGIVQEVHLYTHDFTWLAQVYAPLLEACKCWFTSAAMGWPTWTHLLQTNLDQAPLYSLWRPEDQGIDLRFVDSPALGAMLYHECLALQQIGRWLSQPGDIGWLQKKADEIREHVSASWNETLISYRYRDIQSGGCETATEFCQVKQNGKIEIGKDCGGVRRLVVFCRKASGLVGLAEVEVAGKNGAAAVSEVMHFSPRQFEEGIARLTSEQLYTWIEQIRVVGLDEGDTVLVALAGYAEEDISLLLPLWAGIPTVEQAERLVHQTLMPRYLGKYGLTDLPMDRYPQRSKSVLPFWNQILVEGLLQYGMRAEAAQVMKAFLDGVVSQWQENGFFSSTVGTLDVLGIGERDAMSGLPGVLPLLHLLGVDFIDEKEIFLSGLNKFFSPITVQYGKVDLSMKADSTIVTTLNGSKIEITETGRQRVVLP